MKKYIFLLYALLSLNFIAQIEDPVEWSFSVDSVSEDMRHLVIRADIEKGWECIFTTCRSRWSCAN